MNSSNNSEPLAAPWNPPGFGMTEDQFRAMAAASAERAAIEQDRPPKIEDRRVLRHVLYLMGFPDANGRPIKGVRR
jgi:hypothetical protein